MGINSPRNKKMIRLLAINTLKANRLRFIITSIAIALTALLITGVFTMGLSIYETDQLLSLYRNGGRFHGAIQNINTNDMKTLINSGEFTEHEYLSVLSEYPGLPLEIAYGSKNLPDITLTQITGHMPEKYNEVAMSTSALDRFGVLHKLGEKFTMTYMVGETEKTTEFTVCGFWRENLDGWVMKSKIFVSEEFAKAESFEDNILLFVNLDKPKEVYNRIILITEKLGIKANCITNPVFDEYLNRLNNSGNIPTNMLVSIAMLLVLIMISAYLLIYNIFYISVTRDVKFYGLLRAIGTTKRQIRKIIRLQALSLSLIGIPTGLLIGYLVSVIILPSILVLSNSYYSISSNPLIFVFATFFTLITVLISASRPGTFAGRVSPMAAVKHVEFAIKIRRKEYKTSYGAHLFIMAMRNILRGKKKLVLSIISLSVGIGLFCISTSFMSSFSLDMFLKVRMYGDLRVSNPLLNAATFEDVGDTITPDFIEKTRLLDGVKYTEELFFLETVDANLKSDTVSYIRTNDQLEEIFNVKAEVFGLTGGWIESLSEFISEGEFNPDKFRTGNYCVISKTTKTAFGTDGEYIGAEDIYYYRPGDKIKIKGLDKELIVMALINDISFGITGEGRVYNDRYELYLPADTVSMIDGAKIMSLAIFSDKTQLPTVKNSIRALLSDKDGLELTSSETYKEEFESQTSALTTIALGLSILLCMIGMTNFINTFATSVISRRYEIAVLEGIGMTKVQLKSMLILECLYMGSISLIISFALSYPLSNRIIGNLVRENGFIEFQYSFISILIWLVFICFSSVIISLSSYKSISHDSLSSRLISE